MSFKINEPNPTEPPLTTEARGEDEVFNTKEAAAYLKCATKTLYNYKCSGKLKAFSLGGGSGPLRFRKSDLINFMFGKKGA